MDIEPGELKKATIVRCGRCLRISEIADKGVPGQVIMDLEADGWRISHLGWICYLCSKS